MRCLERNENETAIYAIAPGVQLIAPAEAATFDDCLLSFPAVGDAVRQETMFSPKGNITKDTQEVVRQTQLPALIVPRPSLGRIALSIKNPIKRQQTYERIAGKHAEQLVEPVNDLGIKRLTAFGESLGAVHVLAVTRSDQLPIERVGAWDAPGWFTTTVPQGAPYYFRYIFGGEQATFIAAHPEASGQGPEWYHPSPHRQIIGTMQMVGRQLRDILTSASLLTTDISLRNALFIRDRLPHIAGLIQSPESTFVFPPKLVDRQVILGQLALHASTPRIAPWLVVESVPGLAHESINNIERRLHFISQIRELSNTKP